MTGHSGAGGGTVPSSSIEATHRCVHVRQDSDRGTDWVAIQYRAGITQSATNDIKDDAVPSTPPPDHEPVAIDDDQIHSGPLELQRMLHGVAEISSAVNEPLSIPALLNLVARTACRLMGFDFCGVFLPDRSESVLVVEGSYGFATQYINEVNALHPITIQEGTTQAPSTQAYLSRQPVQVRDTATDPAFAQWGAGAREQGFRSMISVPLLVTGESVGTLNGYTSQERTFSDHEVELAMTLANQVAIAISSARLRTAQARTILDLKSVNSSLEEQHSLAQQADGIHHRLSEVALQEGGVEGVVHALGDLLARSLVVEDPAGRVLGRATVAGHELRTPDVDELDVTDGPESEASPSRDLFDLVGPDGPVSLSQVWLGGDVAAHLWLDGHSSDLTGLDRRAVDHGRTLLAFELLRLRTAQDVEWRTAGDLVLELVRGNPTALSGLETRAERLGHDLSGPHTVLVARPDTASTEGEAGLLGAVRAAATPVDPRPLVGPVGPYVVALWPESDDESEIWRVADSIRATYLRSRARRGSASVTVSSSCRGLAEYAGAFRLGRGIADLAQARGRHDSTIDLGDLGPLNLLLQIEDVDELFRFSSGILGPLREYDERRGTSLATTLSTYVSHDQNTASTAAALHVHPNTVGLRVRRIEELLGLSLTRTESVVHVGMALMADEVARSLEP